MISTASVSGGHDAQGHGTPGPARVVSSHEYFGRVCILLASAVMNIGDDGEQDSQERNVQATNQLMLTRPPGVCGPRSFGSQGSQVSYVTSCW